MCTHYAAPDAMTQGNDRVIAGLQIRHELLVVSAIFHLICCIILLTAPERALTQAVPEITPAEPPVRELALAWQSRVDARMTMAQTQAERLLQTALRQFPDDPALWSALGYYAQKRGDDNQAGALYNRALEYDAASVDAATNLGVLEANRGRAAEASKPWQAAFERAPGRSEIGMNLARLFCQTEQFDAARDSVPRVLRFNPDLGPAKTLEDLNAKPARCGP